MRVVSQNTVCLSSHRRQLRQLQRKQPPVNIPADSVGSRDSIVSSPFPRDHSPPTDIIVGHVADHQNVEELQQLELPVNAKFQHLDNSMKAMEVKHIEDIICISSQ
jgi:hypothetical protein